MKTRVLIVVAAVSIFLGSCASREESPAHPEWTYSSVIYEVNIRQFSEEGTFKAVEAQLPRLKDLGVDVLWLMPMYEIGEVERKGSLGSYYAISDYRKVNPEFGTMQDFEDLLASAHREGFKVILDWVANQTAPDHVWMTMRPADFYERDSLGNATYEYDWTDTRSLNYDNHDVWAAQDSCMRFWLDKGVDGFRCDAAAEMPAAFWYGILPQLKSDYPDAYFLAEAEKAELADPKVTFDANYAWELHHIMNDIAQGRKTPDSLRDYISRDAERFPREAFRLMFTSNHDENSWAGTEFERMGDAARAFAVLCFTLPQGQPLVYTGQEIGLDRRLEFFEKDPVTDWTANSYTAFFKDLIAFRHSNPALLAGERGGEIVWLDGYPEGVLAFTRSAYGNKVQVVVNLTGAALDLPDGTAIEPWGYRYESNTLRVEPLSWWTGMKTDLQLLVQGKDISCASVSIEGAPGIKVKSVHKADHPDFIFVDVSIAANAKAGTYDLIFDTGSERIRHPYIIRGREPGSAARGSFTRADMVYLIMPDRFANGDPSNDDGFSMLAGRPYDDGSAVRWSVPAMAEKSDRSAHSGRHGGDLQGIIDHLDYIADLGATAIWSTPLLLDNEAEGSYHGYACGDYYHIDPRFGDNALYRTFVDECHARGLKVIMDIVTNHCGTAHWWMKDAPFDDWYHKFDEYTGTNVVFSSYMDPYASSYDRNLQESGWFVPSMPDMNLDNPYVLKYFQQWAIWWIEYAGLDGLRVDTYPYNEPGPMSRWCKAVTDEYPGMNIVGECWDTSVPQLAYWQHGASNHDGFDSNLPSIMDFPLREAVMTALTEDTPGWGEGMSRVYGSLAHDFAYADVNNIMTFFANHDHPRTGDVLGRDPRRVKLALAMLATLRGIPQLYYGDEMMFCAHPSEWSDGSKRIDFPGGWPGDSIDLFSEEGRIAGGRTDVADYGSAAELHDYARKLFQWRKGCRTVQEGGTLHYMTRDNTYAYFRHSEESVIFVFVNNSLEDKKIPWDTYYEINYGLSEGVDIVTGETLTVGPETVVPPKTALIVQY